MMQRGRRAEPLLYIGTLIFTAFMLWTAAHLRFYIHGMIGPGLYPTLVLLLLAVVTVILLVQRLNLKEVRVIAPFLDGLERDALLRYLCGVLTRQWGQPIRVMNKTGVGRFAAAHAGRHAPTDGRTLVVLTSDTPDRPGLEAATYALEHFEPLVRLYFDPDVLLVHPGAPWQSLSELVGAGPLRAGFAHHPVYSATLREWLAARLSLELRPVFDEDPKSVLGKLEAGELDLAVLGVGDTQEVLGAARVRALAVASDEPVTNPAVLPTFADQGHALVSGNWAGVLVPKAVDAVTRKQLERDLMGGLPSALREPAAESLMSGLAANWHIRPAEAFRAFLTRMEVNRSQAKPVPANLRSNHDKSLALWVTIAAVLLFPPLMQLVGFPLGAFVFLLGLMALLWPRLELRVLLVILPVSLVLSVGLYWLFWHVFYVVFPTGVLTGF